MVTYSSSRGVWRGSIELCFLVTVTGPKGTALNYVTGGSGWALEKGYLPKCGGHGTGCPGQWAQPQVSESKEHLDSTLRHGVWILSVPL